jgi:hypothetical protein
MKSSNGVLILILGIASWVGFGCLAGVPAWIMGNSAIKDIDAGMADPNERGMVQAGRILGMINTIVVCLGICIWLAVVFGLLGFAAVTGTQTR